MSDMLTWLQNVPLNWIMYLCNVFSDSLSTLHLTLVALFGGIFISFAIGAFFSITYIVPTHLAKKEFERTGNNVSSMFFAVQGLFEGIAAGIATGPILVTLKDKDVISLLPIVVIICCMTAFVLSFFFSKDISLMGKAEVEKKE